jgi:hypothetical protein
MTHLVILAALAAVPLLAILLLRVNGAIAFMSLCLGSVLVTYTSSDVDSLVSNMEGKHGAHLDPWIKVTLFLLPLLLALLFTHGNVKGTKNLINVLPAAATGLLCALLVVPLLPLDIRTQINHQTLWKQLNDAQTAIILGGAVFSLMFLLFTHRRRKSDEEGKKGKHRG